jgi:hypothetical protein
VTPLVGSYTHASDPSAAAAYWQPAVSFLRTHLTASYRVEAVDTSGHWPATYLAEAQIPLARGWFRQDDFPQNKLLYGDLRPAAYLAWLRTLGVRYVVLTNAPPDYSSRSEAALLRSGRSGLDVVRQTANMTIFAVPHPRPLLTGPAQARVLRLTQSRVVLELPKPGRYRLAIRYSPYWHADGACLTRRPDGMTTVSARRSGRLELTFHVNAASALAAAVVGQRSQVCDD